MDKICPHSCVSRYPLLNSLSIMIHGESPAKPVDMTRSPHDLSQPHCTTAPLHQSYKRTLFIDEPGMVVLWRSPDRCQQLTHVGDASRRSVPVDPNGLCAVTTHALVCRNGGACPRLERCSVKLCPKAMLLPSRRRCSSPLDRASWPMVYAVSCRRASVRWPIAAPWRRGSPGPTMPPTAAT